MIAAARTALTVRITLLLTLLACPLLAAETATGPQFDYRQVVLDNGLRVITLEDFSCPIVAAQVWYHVGSKNEKPDRNGFAHMFEHMMFRGTDLLGPTDHFDLIQKAGGDCNGFTSFDHTAYVQTVPANQLALALWLEAERMAFLKIDQAGFDTERKVVEEERRLGLNRPYGTVLEKGLAEVFKRHPYRWPPIGNIAHLRAGETAELRDFWKQYYVPNNAVLVIVGAVKHADAQALAGRFFGWIHKCPDPPKVTLKEPQPTTVRAVTIAERNAPVPAAALAFRTAPTAGDDALAVDLLADILGAGDSSRLHRALVIEKKLAADIFASSYTLEDDGALLLGAVMLPGGNPQAGLDALSEQVSTICAEKVAPRELLKARNRMLKSIVLRNLSVASRARLLGETATDEGDVSRVNTLLERVRKATEDDLLRVAGKYLDLGRAFQFKVESNLGSSVLSKIIPPATKQTSEEDAPITAKPEEKAPPPGRAGAVRPAGYPTTAPVAKPADINAKYDSSAGKLDNGLKVLVVSNHHVPFVTVRLGLLTGAWCEEKPGAAQLAADMITEGTARFTKRQLAEELDTYAISLGGSAGVDSGSVWANCVTEQTGRMMDLLGEVVLHPTFPKEEFDRLVKRTRASLTISSAEPSAVARREFNHRLWGPHPYARLAGLEPADLDGLTTEDLRGWWLKSARPDQAVLIFAGDIEVAKAVELAEKTLGQWRTSASSVEPPEPLAAPTLPLRPPQPAPTRIYLVDRPGLVQSQVRVGQVGLVAKDPGYFDSLVVSEYFGGSFGGRLNRSVRVEKGLTYAIWGGNSARRFAGTFAVSTFSKTDSTAKAVAAILDQLRRLADEPPTEEELDTTRRAIIGHFPAEHETPMAVANDLWLIESNGLPADFNQQMLERVAKTDAAACQKLIRRLVDPSKLVIVVVGDAAKVQAQLEKIAPVTVIQDKTTTAPASAPASAAAAKK